MTAHEQATFFDDTNMRHCQSVSLANPNYNTKVEESFVEDDDYGLENNKSFAEVMFGDADNT